MNAGSVTALALKVKGKVSRVGILDCNQYYGDGTAEIMTALHIDWIRHVSQDHWNPDDAEPFLGQLALRVCRNWRRCIGVLPQK